MRSPRMRPASVGRLAGPSVRAPAVLRYSLEQSAELEFVDRTGQPLRVARPDGGPFRRPIEYGEIPQP